jgi:hypothetical protein
MTRGDLVVITPVSEKLKHMRTKLVLAAAAIIAAGVATSMAQSNVYSLNIVGYVNYTQPANTFRLAANPLIQANNDVANVFTSGPSYPGLTIFKRNSGGTGYDQSTYDGDLASWTDVLDVAPGAGLWVSVPPGVALTNTFVGEVVLNSTNAIPAGYSLKGAILPQGGLIQTALGYPAGFGDTVSIYNGTGYDVYTLDGDLEAWDPAEPNITVGLGFWINNAGAAKTWVRNFTP